MDQLQVNVKLPSVSRMLSYTGETGAEHSATGHLGKECLESGALEWGLTNVWNGSAKEKWNWGVGRSMELLTDLMSGTEMEKSPNSH